MVGPINPSNNFEKDVFEAFNKQKKNSPDYHLGEERPDFDDLPPGYSGEKAPEQDPKQEEKS